jgi:hypothetical protein
MRFEKKGTRLQKFFGSGKFLRLSPGVAEGTILDSGFWNWLRDGSGKHPSTFP